MGNPGKTINVRLTVELCEKFERLAEAVPGLSKGMLVKLLLAQTLNLPLEEQIKGVMGRLLSSEQGRAATRSSDNRRDRLSRVDRSS